MGKACNIQLKNNKNLNLPVEKVKLFNSYKLSKYHKFTDFLIGQIFKEYSDILGWTLRDLNKVENLNKITKALELKFQNILIENANEIEGSLYLKISDEVFTDINDIIIPNFASFIEDYYDNNSVINIVDYDVNAALEQDDEIFESETEDDLPEGEEVEIKGKEFDKGPQEQTMIQLADNEIKTLFKFIPKMLWNEKTKSTELFFDTDGLPTTTESGKVFNMLINRTAGIRDYNSFINTLSDINTLRIVPEASEIKSLLKVDKPIKSKNESLLIINFHNIFSNPKVPVQSALLQKNRNFSIIEEIKSNIENVKQSFISNFQLGNVNENAKPYLQKDELQGYYLDNKKIFPLPKTLREKVDFLSLIGITLTGTQFLGENRDSFIEMFNESVDYIYNSYLERMNKGQVLREPVKELRDKYIPTTPNSKTIKGEFTSIDKLIEFESNYTRLSPSLSSRNSEGELQYLISLENQITLVTSQLNNAKTLKELQESSAFTNVKNNPLFSQSYIIEFLFDKNGNKIIDEQTGLPRSISIGNLSGLKIQTSSKNTAKLERDLSPKEKLFQDFNMMLLSGRTDTVRTETSNTFYNIGIKNEKGKNVLFYQNNSFLNNFKDNNYFKRQMFKYLQGEKARVKSYADKKLENPNLPETYGKFFIFNNILENNPELKKSILENNLTIDSPLFKTFMDRVDNVMAREVQVFKNEMDNLGMEQDKLLSENLKKLEVPFDALVRAFIANTFTQNIEFAILYSGDALFFQKKGPEYHKRLKGLVSTGNLASSIPVINDYFNTPDEKAFEKKYSLSGMMGVTRRNNDKTFNTKTLKEYKQSSDFAYSQDSIIDEIHKSIIKRDGKEGKFSKDVIKNEVLKDKNDQKPADGQGYVNLDFHRELAFRYGFLTDDLEDAYKYEGLIYKKNFINGGLTIDEKTEFLNLEKKIFENPDKYGIPVLKVTYYGPIANTTVDAKAYDKFSIAPLLPSDFIKESKLKKLSDDMIKQQIGYVKYNSGTKLFTTPPIDILEVESTKPDLYNTELLKLQIKPKIKQSTSTAIPTQLLKLIFSNLFNNGASKDNVKPLMDKYISSLKGIQKTQTEALLKDMGISDTVDYNILSEKLIKQARLQKLSSNVISALEDAKIGGFGSLEKSGFISQIIDLMAGYADSNLRRFELPGGDFVLVSNANRSKLKFYKYSDTGTMACECKITLTKEHSKLLRKLHPDGQPIGSLDRLNKLLLNKEWVKENEKSLIVLLDRVPTQGPNSMDFAIVKEFLSPTSGNIIILPEEIVYKSGTDFDYDKEKVLLPSLTYNGEYISEENLPVLREKIRKLEEEYGELLNQAEQEDTDEAINKVINAIFNDPFASNVDLAVYDKLNEVEDMIKTYFKLQKPGDLDFAKNANSIIEVYKDTLALPEMFAELVIPNSTRTLKPYAERNARLAQLKSSLPINEQVYHYVSNLFVKNIFFDSKNMLAPFAISNNFNQMMQYFKINIKNAYYKYGIKQSYGRSVLPQTINNLLLKDSELEKITDNDRLLTSLRDDIDGYIKQHWDSETINATVDAAKDPWFALMRINRKNIGVVIIMKALGYPMSRILDFINQPILQEYFTLLNNGLSKNQALSEIGKKLGLKDISPVQGDLIQTTAGLNALKNDPSVEIISVDNVNGGFSVQFRKIQALNASKFKKSLLSIDNRDITPKNDNYKLLEVVDFNEDVIDRLESNIKNTMKLDSLNIRVLAHFIAMEDHNNAFSKFRYYFNFDTTKVSTPTDLFEKTNQRSELFNDELFDAEDLIRMEQNTMMSAFINNDVIKRMFDKTLSLLQNEKVQNTLASLYNAYKRNRKSFNKRNLRLLPKTLNNDFLTSVLFNYYTEDNKSFIKNNMHLLVRSEGKKTIADRLESFKNMPFYKDLSSKFPILENFIIEKHVIKNQGDYNQFKVGTVIDNIRMIKSNNESPLEFESNIDQLRTLYNYVIDNPSYKEEDLKTYNKALKLFVDDLFKVGLLQSGMSKTYIGFSEFIPYEFVKKYYDKAITNYENQPEFIKNRFLDNFYAQFIYNNPKFFPNIKEGEKYVKNSNNYSHKFKRYDINLNYKFDEIMSEESEELRIREQNEPLNQSNINTLIDEQLVRNELTNGRYSFYPTEEDVEKDNGTIITKDNVDKAIETEKKLGDVIYNNKSNILTGIPSPQIEVEIADGIFEEFTSAKELEDFINDTKVSKNDRDKARIKYNELKSTITGISVGKNIYKGAVQEFIQMLGGKKTSKGLLQVDGQHYYLDMDRWIILDKSNRKELFLRLSKPGERLVDEIYIGSAPSNSNNFISENFNEDEFNEWKDAIIEMKFNEITDNRGYIIKINNSDVKLLDYNELDLYSEERVLQLDVMSKSGLEYKVFFDGDKYILPETKEYKEILSLIIEEDDLTSDDFKCNI